ncbi:hypothetical protein FHR90_001751 [Endobacter medicaginis]|uniref:FeoB-associated Cys-rich membrane protein n=1 Tax=Endobacter medicaginis TaxID=1181271 RepID=A0A839V311_9PROT|nr:DUF6587 family protein [Endobacter medicaginis]MBB3173919.1 hypothetical protein [Endobacter medicaginis]MCX5475960.1 hypothetical protein [Endobacter medicaginis]
MTNLGLVLEYVVVGLIVLACALYWGRRLLPRTRPVAAAGDAARPSSCGGCRNCDGGGCH